MDGLHAAFQFGMQSPRYVSSKMRLARCSHAGGVFHLSGRVYQRHHYQKALASCTGVPRKMKYFVLEFCLGSSTVIWDITCKGQSLFLRRALKFEQYFHIDGTFCDKLRSVSVRPSSIGGIASGDRRTDLQLLGGRPYLSAAYLLPYISGRRCDLVLWTGLCVTWASISGRAPTQRMLSVVAFSSSEGSA